MGVEDVNQGTESEFDLNRLDPGNYDDKGYKPDRTDEEPEVTEPEESVTEESVSEETEPEQPEAEDEPKRGHQLDKGLQKTQQRVAAIEKTMATMTSRIEALLEKIESQGGKATKAQSEQLEELKDQAKEVMDDLDDDSLLTARDARRIREEIRKEVLSEIEDRTRKQQEEARKQQEAVQNWLASYDPETPELKGRGEEVLRQYQAEMAKYPSFTRMTKAEQETLMAERLYVAEQIVASRVKSAAPTPAKVTRTPSLKPDKSTEGTRSISKSVPAAPTDAPNLVDSYADRFNKVLQGQQ